MILETLKSLFNRDLLKLKTEIELYRNEDNLWRITGSISNSAGNLCLHLIGNLNTYIGAGLLKTNYVRQRDLEFSLKNISKAELIEKIEATIAVVDQGLDSLSVNDLVKDFPIMIRDKSTEMEYILLHLLTHLNYHLGQINYHRRLLDND